MYINGRPLPHHIRVQIVEMSKRNIKPCEISRELRISHGAVSKILNRYASTGTLTPGQIGGNPRQRLSIQSVEKPIAIIKEERPDMTTQEIQQYLVDNHYCTRINVPSISSINRHLKARGLVLKRACSAPKSELIEPPPLNADLWLNLTTKQPSPASNQKPKFSIDNILNNMVGQNNNDQKPTCSSSDERSESESSTPIGRSRTYFTPEQVEMLEKAYDSNPYPDQTEKEQIALKSGLNENKVQVWFSNRRARQRKNLTNSTIYEYQLRSATIQQQQQFVQPPKTESPVTSIPLQMNPVAIQQPAVPFLNQPQYASFAQPPMTLWNYLQQQQLMQVLSAFQQQQNQPAKCIP
ncbi:Protein gooseberry [Aphelenchoides bicaudatus]|nr:Protein gooseberry [Aphelenchoides bicaudatus]